MKSIELPFPLRDQSVGLRGTPLGNVTRNLLHYKSLFIAVVVLVMGLACVYLLAATRQYSSDVLLQVAQNKRSPFDAALTVAQALQPGGSPLAGEMDVLSSRATLIEAIDETHADIRVQVASYFPIIGHWYANKHDDPTALTDPLFGLSRFAWGGERLHIAALAVPRHLENTKMKLTVLPRNRWSLKDEEGNKLGSGTVGIPARLEVKSGTGHVQDLDITVASVRARPGTSFFVVKNSVPYFLNNIASGAMSVSESSRDSSMIRLSYLDADPQFAANFVNAVARSFVRQTIARKSEESQGNLRFLDDQLDLVGKRLERSESALNVFKRGNATLDLSAQTADLLKKSMDIEARRAQLNIDRAAMLTHFQPGSRSVVEIDQKLEALASQSAASNKDIMAAPELERQYLGLQRDVQVNRAIYTGLLENKEQIAVMGKSAVNNVQVIDWGLAAEETAKPKARIILPVAFGLSLLLGVLFVQGVVTVRDRVTGPESLTMFDPWRVHLLGPLRPRSRLFWRRRWSGELRKARMPLVLTQPTSLTLSVLHGLADTIERVAAERQSNITVFVSHEKCDRVVDIIDILGHLMSRRGRRVLLVDWTQPGSQNLADRMAVGTNIQSILADEHAFGAAVMHSEQCHVDILSASAIGASVPAEAPVMRERRYGVGAPWASARYDDVIVGMSLVDSSDALSVARFAAAVYVVGRVYETGNDEIANTITRVKQVGTDVTGVVLCK